MSKKVMLIMPPYHCGVVEAAGTWPPLTLQCLAGPLLEAGHEVEIYDAMSEFDDLVQVEERLRQRQPEVVGISAYTATMNAALEVAKIAKRLNPDGVIVLGGVHPTFMYEEIFTQNPGLVDYIVRGEGEITFPELLKAMENGDDLRKVQGIAYTSSGEIVVTPDRPLIENLDMIRPAWDLIDYRKYPLHVVEDSRIGIVFASRGCDKECSFCSQRKLWRQTHRARSLDAFIGDVDYLYRKHGVNVFLLADEFGTNNRERWESLLDALIEKSFDARFLVETRVEDIVRDADIMDKYVQAGILHIYIGVEAAEQETLDYLKKEITIEQSREAIRLIKEAGMISECSFILGFPDETEERIKKTLELAIDYDPDFAHFLMLAPWPYADIYEEMKPYVKNFNYADYNLVTPVVEPKNMTLDEIFDWLLYCYKNFYMQKIPKWMKLESAFKKDYCLSAAKLIMMHSFLRKHMVDLGKMPGEMKMYFEEGRKQKVKKSVI